MFIRFMKNTINNLIGMVVLTFCRSMQPAISYQVYQNTTSN